MQTAGSLLLDNYISQPDLDPDSFFPGYHFSELLAFSCLFSEKSFRKDKRLEKMFTELFLHLASGIQLSVKYIFLLLPFRKIL